MALRTAPAGCETRARGPPGRGARTGGLAGVPGHGCGSDRAGLGDRLARGGRRRAREELDLAGDDLVARPATGAVARFPLLVVEPTAGGDLSAFLEVLGAGLGERVVGDQVDVDGV